MKTDCLKILVLGGYGTFGGRLAELLRNEKRLTIFVAGRSLKKAAAFSEKMKAAADLQPIRFDRTEPIEPQLADIGPDLVVDASGPFQSYEGDPYRVVKACLALRIHYLDLADASDFVKGIAQFNEHAREREIVILSGVSSFPVLTVAVIRQLSAGFTHIEKVVAGIAPSPYAGVGLNVIRAISAYAGKKVDLTRDGKKAHGYGLVETCRYTVAPPGMMPLHNTRFSLVDVPDLTLIPELWPDIRSIWMGAGPVPEVLHRALNALSWLVKIRVLPSLSPLAPLFHAVINVLRWGEHRGGMFVSVEGLDAQGKQRKRSWHMLAEGSDGPFIPSMAVEGIVRKWLSGNPPLIGARAAINDLELSDYEKLFSERLIRFGFRNDVPKEIDEPLYPLLIDDAWGGLPSSLRIMHQGRGVWTARGMASVERGRNIASRFIAALFRFPKASSQTPIKVRFEAKNGTEVWRRTFGRTSFSSTQYEGAGRSERLLCERFGPFVFAMALVLDQKKLRLVVRRWSFLGIPLPIALAPRGEAYEKIDDLQRFNFHVEIALPWIGLLVRYRGWLVPTDEEHLA